MSTSLLIALTLANPSPADVANLHARLERLPALQGVDTTLCVNDEECVEVGKESPDVFDPRKASFQRMWETVYDYKSNKPVEGGHQPAPSSSGGGSGGGSVAAVGEVLGRVLEATSAGGNVEIEYKNSESDGTNTKTTEVKVKVGASKGRTLPPLSNISN